MKAISAFILSLTLAGPVAGQSADRNTTLRSKFDVLDGRAASQYAGSVKLRPVTPRIPSRDGVADVTVARFSGRYKGPHLQTARQAARKHAVPEELFLRLVQQESGWNAAALSHKGAIGLAQLMPGTARRLKVDPYSPAENLDGGARYLRQQYEAFGDWRLALAAYNAGPGAVLKYGGVPPYRETMTYVKVILGS